MRRRCLGLALALAMAALAFCPFLLACAGSSGGGIHAKMGYSETGGLRVVEVPRKGPGWEAGLRPGDRIVAIDGKPVREMSMKQVVKRLRGRAGTRVKLKIQRDDQMKLIVVRRERYAPY